MAKVYLDYAASTPVDKRVISAMAPYFDKVFGNPHSIHGFGQEASAAAFKARRTIAAALGANYQEIIFTGSATEANNLAIRGVVKGWKDRQKGNPKVITTVIEHESVLETCRDLEREGVEVIYLPVNRAGLVDLKKLEAALDERTALVSVMHANNEVGVIQPIAEIAAIIKKARKPGYIYPLLHSDAVQSFQYCDARPAALGADLLTLSAHKIYGPKGIGALFCKDLPNHAGILHPIITGSGQEYGLRSGTDNVPYIVGFAKAVEIADKMRVSETARIAGLSDYFWGKIHRSIPGTELNGSAEHRLPNNLNIYFPGHKAHELLIRLDLAGVATSPGAACRSAVAKASYVIAEMGFPMERAEGSLRFSCGRQTTKTELDSALRVIVEVVAGRKK